MHGMDAPVAGSGKSLVLELASILVTGHGAVVMSQGETREETESGAHATTGSSAYPWQERGGHRPNIGAHRHDRQQPHSQGRPCPAHDCRTHRPKMRSPELRQYDFDPIAYAMENCAGWSSIFSRCSRATTTRGARIGRTSFSPSSIGRTRCAAAYAGWLKPSLARDSPTSRALDRPGANRPRCMAQSIPKRSCQRREGC